jgi:hypothetical protein
MGHLLHLSWYRYCRIRNTKERCGKGDRMKTTYTHFIAAYLPLSLTTIIPMAESDHDSESSLSESLDTKTLQARSMVLASFRNPPESESGQNPIWMNDKQFIKIDTLTIPATSAALPPD